MKNNIIKSFLEKLIDWKEFELFVADIYSDSEEVIVEHNKTLIGKSGAKRQIDVLVTQKTKLHTYQTIIECKRWKKPITRQVIDVLFASIEDLNVSKGVIFTTKGYEKGAIEYAKSKNVDIFIVRDIREDEYGNLGKVFSLYLQMFSGRIEKIDFQNVKWFSPNGTKLRTPVQPFRIHFTEDQTYPKHMQLLDLNHRKGPNLVKLLINIRSLLLKDTLKSFNHLLQPENVQTEIGYKTRVKLDLTKYSYKFIKHDDGFIQLDNIFFDFITCLDQSKMTFDKTSSLDFALIVENFVSRQKNFVSKPKSESNIILSEPIVEDKDQKNESDILQPDSIMKLTTEHWVDFKFKKDTKVIDTKEITVTVK